MLKKCSWDLEKAASELSDSQKKERLGREAAAEAAKNGTTDGVTNGTTNAPEKPLPELPPRNFQDHVDETSPSFLLSNNKENMEKLFALFQIRSPQIHEKIWGLLLSLPPAPYIQSLLVADKLYGPFLNFFIFFKNLLPN